MQGVAGLAVYCVAPVILICMHGLELLVYVCPDQAVVARALSWLNVHLMLYNELSTAGIGMLHALHAACDCACNAMPLQPLAALCTQDWKVCVCLCACSFVDSCAASGLHTTTCC
jgi:hypothetical protein